MGHGGPIAWPALSSDLNPLDYYLWGHMKSLIYDTPVSIEENLLARVMAVTDVGGSRIGDRMYQSTIWRYRICVNFGGSHIEPFLKERATCVVIFCVQRENIKFPDMSFYVKRIGLGPY